MNQFDDSDIQLHVVAENRMEAIRLAANILVEKKSITDAYIDEMYEVMEEYGPYFVLAPGMAFAHSRPSVSVHKTGVSLITLKEPVVFGNEKNDPVFLVCVIASINNTEHLEMLKKIVGFLSSQENVELLKRAETNEDKRQIIDLLNQ